MSLSNLYQDLALWNLNIGGNISVTEPKSNQLISRDLGVAVKQVVQLWLREEISTENRDEIIGLLLAKRVEEEVCDRVNNYLMDEARKTINAILEEALNR